jgi:DUF1365 family protein
VIMPSHASDARLAADLSRKVQELEAELAAARQREAATTDILKVISSSPTDLHGVMEIIAHTGTCMWRKRCTSLPRR